MISEVACTSSGGKEQWLILEQVIMGQLFVSALIVVSDPPKSVGRTYMSWIAYVLGAIILWITCLRSLINQLFEIMITSLSEDIARPASKRQALQQFQIIYSKLHNFIDDINSKIINRVQLVQQVYADDYRQQITLMAEELHQMRLQFDAQLLKQRSNEKLFYLEEERDFFRAQVLKLSEEVSKCATQNQQLKQKLKQAIDEVDNYKKMAFNYETKLQKMREDVMSMNKTAKESPQISSRFKQLTPMPNSERKMSTPKNNSPSESNQKIRLKHSHSVRTHAQTHKNDSLTRQTLKNFEQSCSREQIIDDCIKQIKKQIFYRTMDLKDTHRVHFDEFAKIPFDRFTKTDRKELIANLMSNQEILSDFNDFLLKKQSQTQADRFLRTKISDEKHNDKVLANIKQQFSKRIFDLKANRI